MIPARVAMNDEMGEKKTAAMGAFDKLFRQVAGIGRIFSQMAGLEKIPQQLVYKGGRPGVKTKKPRGPIEVA